MSIGDHMQTSGARCAVAASMFFVLLTGCDDFRFLRGGPKPSTRDQGRVIVVINNEAGSGGWQQGLDGSPKAPDTGGVKPDAYVPPPKVDAAPPTGACGSTFESEVFNLVNQIRGQNGKAPLACALDAGKVSRAYSEYMCSAGFFSHTGKDGSSPSSRLRAAGVTFYGAGENIAAGQRSSQAVMDSWMKSSGHRANILGNYSHIGVGYAPCPRGYRHYWTQNFLKR